MKIPINKNVETALKILTTSILLLFIFVSFFKPLEFEDGWWHLATGRWIVQHGAVPHYDPFSFTDKPHPWVFTQWLGSTIFYLVYALSGIPGLKFFRFLIFFLSILIFVLYNRKKIPFYYLAILAFFLVSGLERICLLRPMIFNALFLQFILIILLGYEKTRDHKKLLWLLPLGALWSNLHLGSFVYGTPLIGVFLFSAIVEYGNFLINKKTLCYPTDHVKPIKDLFLGLLLFWLSMVISPYGINALLYPWKVFLFPEFINFYKTTRIIAEQLSPNILKPELFWLYPLLGLAFFTLTVSLKRLKNKLTILFLTILSFFCFLYSHRLADIALVVLTYMLVLAFPKMENFRAKKFFLIYLGAIFFYIILFAGTMFYVRMNMYVVQNGTKERLLFRNFFMNDHQAAIKFLASLKTPNRVFCNDDLGGYIIWSLYPKSKPFVDGRQIDQNIFFNEFVPWGGNPLDLWMVLDKKYDFQIAFLGLSKYSYVLLAKQLNKDPAWELALVDDIDVLFIKKNFADTQKNIFIQENIDNSELSVKEKEAFNQIVGDPMTQPKHATFLQEETLYIKERAQAATFFNIGYRNQAIREIIKLNTKYKENTQIIDTARKFYRALAQENKEKQNTK